MLCDSLPKGTRPADSALPTHPPCTTSQSQFKVTTAEVEDSKVNVVKRSLGPLGNESGRRPPSIRNKSGSRGRSSVSGQFEITPRHLRGFPFKLVH